MTLPSDLPGIIADLYREVGEIKRRVRNRKRTGTVTEVDHKKGLARVKFSEPGGEAYIGPWMPWGEVASGGTKSHIAPTVGEQVNVISESGDLTDGEISMSVPSNANPRPHDGPEPVITYGDTRLQINKNEFTFTGTVRIKKGSLVIEDGDADITGSVHFKGPSVRHNAKNIGDTHIHSGVTPGGGTTADPAN